MSTADGLLTAGKVVLTDQFRNDDVFGRFRVSMPFNVYQVAHTNQQLVDEQLASVTAGGGTVTLDSNRSVGRLQVFNTNDRAVEQSAEYPTYIPGMSRMIYITGNLNYNNVSSTGIKACMGLYDDAGDKTTGGDSSFGNGHFLMFSNGVASFVERTSISGTQTDTVVNQSSWNVDPLDGTGESGETLDFTKNLLMFIQIAWLGVGVVRMGFIYNDLFLVAHKFTHVTSNSPYTQTASLPVRWEVENESAGTLTYQVSAGCAAVQSEGLPTRFLYRKHAGMVATRSVSKATELPIMSIRLASAYVRSALRVSGFSAIVDTGDEVRWYVRVGGTLTGASFSAVSGSQAEIDIAATSITGGVNITGGMLTQNQTYITIDSLESRPATADIAGTPEILTVVMINAFGSGTAACAAALDWVEYQ